MLLWFEAVHDLLTSDLQKGVTPLLNLTDEFFDYFLVSGLLGSDVWFWLCRMLYSGELFPSSQSAISVSVTLHS